jgi:hypothetical protein
MDLLDAFRDGLAHEAIQPVWRLDDLFRRVCLGSAKL